jgi:CheY-like chemotaxis protein
MAKAKILIVEDENIVVLDLQMRLNSLGYAVAAVAATGQEAIKKAGETRPDLALMDINLKGEMDGISAAEQLRARYDLPVTSCTRPSKWLFTNTRWSVS